jgi:hypothetical protein
MTTKTAIVLCRHAIIAAALIIMLGACQRTVTGAMPQAIDWRTSPLDLNLRGMNGKRYQFRCPAGKATPDSVSGMGLYTDGSSICAAAAHAGAIDAQRGGLVTIQILPGQNGYRGSTQNFIRSDDYPQAWGGSFAVLSAADFSADKPPP